jgi:hypothetical protein
MNKLIIEPFQSKPAPRLTYKEKVKAGLVKSKPWSQGATTMTTTGLKRTGKLQPVSKAKRKVNREYHSWIAFMFAIQMSCSRCRVLSTFSKMDPHHPYGRHGDNLFKVIPMCRTCHTWTHEHPNSAYDLGYLQPEYRGLKPDPDHPKPFTLIPGP